MRAGAAVVGMAAAGVEVPALSGAPLSSGARALSVGRSFAPDISRFAAAL